MMCEVNLYSRHTALWYNWFISYLIFSFIFRDSIARCKKTACNDVNDGIDTRPCSNIVYLPLLGSLCLSSSTGSPNKHTHTQKNNIISLQLPEKEWQNKHVGKCPHSFTFTALTETSVKRKAFRRLFSSLPRQFLFTHHFECKYHFSFSYSSGYTSVWPLFISFNFNLPCAALFSVVLFTFFFLVL